jgi:lipopolysaccharide transport system permease protein
VHSLLESWQHRELIFFFAWREVKIRYKQALLGAAWAILQPLLSMIVFTLFFGRLAGIPSDGLPYALFAYVGLLQWTYFSGVIANAGQSLTSNANLITKVYFPRLALPSSLAISGLLDFVIGLSFLFVLMIYFQSPLHALALLAPFFVLQMVLLSVGVSLLLAAVNVFYRDVKHVLPLAIQLWLFLTPVIYPVSFIPERHRPWLALNPLAGIIDGFRSCLVLGQWPNLWLTASSWAITLLVLWLGFAYFRQAERRFADVI